MSWLLYRVGMMIRETGQALERVGVTLQGSRSFTEQFYRHRPVMNLETKLPTIGQDTFVAPSASIIGEISLGDKSSVWYGSVLRGDDGKVTLGAGSNVQDGSTITTVRSNLHGDHQWDTHIGNNVTIGHNVALHGCTIEDAALIGMGATLMEGSIVQSGAMVAAGAVVAPETTIPAGEVWGGNPARRLRTLKPEESSFLMQSAEHYASLAFKHAQSTSKSPLESAGKA